MERIASLIFLLFVAFSCCQEDIGQALTDTQRKSVHGRRNRRSNSREHAHRRSGDTNSTNTHLKPFLLPIPTGKFEIPEPWANISMPTVSYFAGFSPPRDPRRWRIAQMQASRGEQVLLSKVLEAVKSPFDLIHGERNFKWIHSIPDFYKSKNGWLNDLEHLSGDKAYICMLGYRRFDRGLDEGNLISEEFMSPLDILRGRKEFKIPRKIVGIGAMDENWGWLSTYFLNRTVTWAMNLESYDSPYKKDFQYSFQEMKFLLDDPNLVMLVVNQHHNCSHPKVISFPLGINNPREVWNAIHRAIRSQSKKNQLFFSASSNWGFRPMIRQCIAKNIGEDMIIEHNLRSDEFRQKLIQSMAVLAMPGLGYDTYRLWETLAAGYVTINT